MGAWDPGGRRVEPFWPVAWRDKSSGDQQKVTGQGVQDLDFLIVKMWGLQCREQTTGFLDVELRIRVRPAQGKLYMLCEVWGAADPLIRRSS